MYSCVGDTRADRQTDTHTHVHTPTLTLKPLTPAHILHQTLKQRQQLTMIRSVMLS